MHEKFPLTKANLKSEVVLQMEKNNPKQSQKPSIENAKETDVEKAIQEADMVKSEELRFKNADDIYD